MARPLPHPILGLPKGQGPGDEGPAEGVGAEGAFVLSGARQVGALHLSDVQVTSDAVGHVIHSEGASVLIDEDQLFGIGPLRARLVRGASGDPLFERRSHARGESPKAGMVRLVFVEAHGFVLEVDVFDLQGRGFLPADSLAMEEGVKDPPFEGHLLAAEQLLVFARVQDGEALARAGGGEPALGNR